MYNYCVPCCMSRRSSCRTRTRPPPTPGSSPSTRPSPSTSACPSAPAKTWDTSSRPCSRPACATSTQRRWCVFPLLMLCYGSVTPSHMSVLTPRACCVTVRTRRSSSCRVNWCSRCDRLTSLASSGKSGKPSRNSKSSTSALRRCCYC
jgi:hypothetical protein